MVDEPVEQSWSTKRCLWGLSTLRQRERERQTERERERERERDRERETERERERERETNTVNHFSKLNIETML